MNNTFASKFGYWVGWLGLFSIYLVGFTGMAQANCYRTPAQAALSVKEDPLTMLVSDGGGYRLANVRSDSVLGWRWAMIVSCEHPGWPAFAFRIDGLGSVSSSLETSRVYENVMRAAAPVVRSGEVVRLWKQEKLLRIEVAGVSEESGGLGKSIHVRLLHPNEDAQFAQKQFSGIVRGASDVEIEP
jgi:hypothetical protein